MFIVLVENSQWAEDGIEGAYGPFYCKLEAQMFSNRFEFSSVLDLRAF